MFAQLNNSGKIAGPGESKHQGGTSIYFGKAGIGVVRVVDHQGGIYERLNFPAQSDTDGLIPVTSVDLIIPVENVTDIGEQCQPKIGFAGEALEVFDVGLPQGVAIDFTGIDAAQGLGSAKTVVGAVENVFRG